MIPPCKTCGPAVDCVDVYPPDIYSLDGPKFGFVLICPPGQSCDSNIINLICCGQIIQVNVPNGVTGADRIALINEGLRKCVIANFFCGGGTGLPPDGPDAPQPPLPPPPPQELFYSNPVDLTKTCPDGTTFHYRLPAGFYVARSQSEADALARSYAATHAGNYQFCLRVPTLCTCTDTLTLLSIPIAGGVAPFSASAVSGHVPDGMTVTASGHYVYIAGTPTTPGTYSFNINVSDTHGNYLIKSVSMRVINIGYGAALTLGFLSPSVAGTVTSAIASTDFALNDIIHLARQVAGVNTMELGTYQITALDNPVPGLIQLTNLTATPGFNVLAGDIAYWDLDTPLPDLTVGNPYSFQLPAAGGSGSYTWTETGDLPDGLLMSITGLISGIPTSTDSKTFTVTVSDDAC